MDWLLRDIRYGSRSLARSPGFTVIAAITLAIGISANTSIFSVIEAVILRPLPYKDPARLVLLADSGNPEDGGFLYKDFDVIKSQNRTLEDIAEYFRDSGFSRLGIVVQPLRINLTGNTRLAFAVLFSAVVFILLIACTNVANLLLARGSAREREIAIRAALGANRTRIVRQLFTENALLAAVSGCLGLLLSPLGVKGLIALAPSDIPRIHEAGLDGGVLAFTFGICFIAAVFFGLVPAWRMVDTIQPLKSFGAGIAANLAVKRAHDFFVIAEFAIVTVLLVGAGLLVRSFVAIESVDPGFEAEQILTMNISLPGATRERTNDSYNTVLERVRGLPGVQAAGAVDSLLDLGKISDLGLRSIEGRSPEPEERWTPLRWTAVRGDYFQAMGARLLRGRYFAPQDGPNSPLVAIIDERMARRYWTGEDAIGRRFQGQDARGQNDDWLTVVGIVADMRRSGLDKEPIPHVYEPNTQAIGGYRTADLVVRVAGSAGALSSPLRAVVRESDRAALLSSVMTLQTELWDQLSPRRFQALLLSLFSLVALLLAGVGIYGVLGYSVTRRTHEIGIRMALGAHPREVARLVVKDGAKFAVIGLLIGVIGAAAITQFLKSLLFGIASTDPVTFVGVAVLLMATALLACYLPAQRAARVDPIVALRYE